MRVIRGFDCTKECGFSEEVEVFSPQDIKKFDERIEKHLKKCKSTITPGDGGFYGRLIHT